MDPDVDLEHRQSSANPLLPPPSSHSNSHRSNGGSRRNVSRAVAFPNSSRRATAVAARDQKTRSPIGRRVGEEEGGRNRNGGGGNRPEQKYHCGSGSRRGDGAGLKKSGRQKSREEVHAVASIGVGGSSVGGSARHHRHPDRSDIKRSSRKHHDKVSEAGGGGRASASPSRTDSSSRRRESQLPDQRSRRSERRQHQPPSSAGVESSSRRRDIGKQDRRGRNDDDRDGDSRAGNKQHHHRMSGSATGSSDDGEESGSDRSIDIERDHFPRDRPRRSEEQRSSESERDEGYNMADTDEVESCSSDHQFDSMLSRVRSSDSSENNGSMVSSDHREKGCGRNSPELNPRNSLVHSAATESSADRVAACAEQLQRDPPDRRCLEPNYEETQSLLSRFDAPPSPGGPERNRSGGGDGFGGGVMHGNSTSNEEDSRQAQLLLLPFPHARDAEDVSNGLARLRVRGRDPPAAGEVRRAAGADPPPAGRDRGERRGAAGSPAVRQRHGGGKGRDGRGAGDMIRKGEDAVDVVALGEEEKKRKMAQSRKESRRPSQPEIKSILKKKGGPIPITQFGQPVKANGVNDEDCSVASGDSDPNMTEWKQGAPPVPRQNEAPPQSGLRRGKYAVLNAAASSGAVLAAGGDSASRDGDWGRHAANAGAAHDDGKEAPATCSRHEVKGEGLCSAPLQLAHINDEASEAMESCPPKHSSDASSDENQLRSSAHDRSRSHFMRTSDLGLTQDTIFAEQFLDDVNTKAEPHYHHPSPHPPPGVQFHVSV